MYSRVTQIEEAPDTRKNGKWDMGARWTKKLVMNSGWTPVVDIFLDNYGNLNITSGEAMFLIHLMRYKWDESMPFPAFFTIAEKMKVTDISVRKYARDLEAKGYIIRMGRKGKTTAFDLNPLFAALEKYIPEEASVKALAYA